MNDITIPPEALKAAARSVAALMVERAASRTGWTVPDFVEAACLAMLRNWPGIHVTDHYAGDLDNNLSHREITLPLPKEGK